MTPFSHPEGKSPGGGAVVDHPAAMPLLPIRQQAAATREQQWTPAPPPCSRTGQQSPQHGKVGMMHIKRVGEENR